MEIQGLGEYFVSNFVPSAERHYESLWHQVANGQWYSKDGLGISSDKHTCVLTYEGTNSEVRALEQFLKDTDNRYTGIVLTLEEGEEIFGCEFDYSNPILCRIFDEPNYNYTELDWAVIEFKLLFAPESKIYLPTPSKPLCELPISLGVTRAYKTGNRDFMMYDGDLNTTYDCTYSYIVSANYTLDYEQAVFLKKTLIDLRINSMTLPNTYFGLTGETDEPEDIEVKVIKFNESKSGRNMYSINVEYAF